jgi:hypothetical protein
MHCNGKCYLAKQLKKVNPDNTSDKKGSSQEDYSLYYLAVDYPQFDIVFLPTVKKHCTIYCSSFLHSYICDIFQPPGIFA